MVRSRRAAGAAARHDPHRFLRRLLQFLRERSRGRAQRESNCRSSGEARRRTAPGRRTGSERSRSPASASSSSSTATSTARAVSELAAVRRLVEQQHAEHPRDAGFRPRLRSRSFYPRHQPGVRSSQPGSCPAPAPRNVFRVSLTSGRCQPGSAPTPTTPSAGEPPDTFGEDDPLGCVARVGLRCRVLFARRDGRPANVGRPASTGDACPTDPARCRRRRADDRPAEHDDFFPAYRKLHADLPRHVVMTGEAVALIPAAGRCDDHRPPVLVDGPAWRAYFRELPAAFPDTALVGDPDV